MKPLLIVLVVLVVCAVGVGFYRGWFAMSSPGSPGGQNDVNVNLKVDKDKIEQDVQTVKDKSAELTGNAPNDFTESDDSGKDNDNDKSVEE